MRNMSVLVSGGGIAGPATAYWLRQYGFRPTLVERATGPRTGGYKIDLRGAAVTVAQRMGLYDDIRKLTTDVQGGSFVDSSGTLLDTVSGDTFGMRSGQDIEILRGDLSTLLHERLRDRVEWLFDDSITALEEQADGVRMAFANSGPRTFDFIIGADGLHSNVRALALGPEPQFTRELGLYISIFTVPNHWQLDRWEIEYNEPGKLINVFSVRGDTDAKAAFVFASDPLDFDPSDVPGQKQLLTQAYADASWETPRLLDAMADAPDFYFDSVTQIHTEHLSAGRVALVGDAGYCPSPVSGQGTSLAMVGAYILAGELASADGDHQAAFARYEQRMRRFITANQELGRLAAKSMKPDAPTSATRAWLSAKTQHLTAAMPGSQHLSRAFRTWWITRAANSITLPDYGARTWQELQR
jgi:2-polyprenyl-6-methoxyphenol hydroxylase-like FAD-dependent oxidoreductase